jgi:hypothetical protein
MVVDDEEAQHGGFIHHGGATVFWHQVQDRQSIVPEGSPNAVRTGYPG